MSSGSKKNPASLPVVYHMNSPYNVSSKGNSPVYKPISSGRSSPKLSSPTIGWKLFKVQEDLEKKCFIKKKSGDNSFVVAVFNAIKFDFPKYRFPDNFRDHLKNMRLTTVEDVTRAIRFRNPPRIGIMHNFGRGCTIMYNGISHSIYNWVKNYKSFKVIAMFGSRAVLVDIQKKYSKWYLKICNHDDEFSLRILNKFEHYTK
jgi:hypothetical protein